MTWPSSNSAPSPLEDPNEFRNQSTKALKSVFDVSQNSSLQEKSSGSSTVVYPILQLTPLLRPDYSTELPALIAILTSLSTPSLLGSSWTFTAGYFNMTPSVQRLLLSTNPSSGTLIAASPWANGFYGSAGVSGLLPAAYTHLSKRFLQAVRFKGLGDQINLLEWRNGTVNTPGGWSYHAKGIWVTLPHEKHPSLSIVGSSNYTKRSYGLDLEANVAIVTRDSGLMQRLGDEVGWLKEHAKVVTEEDYGKKDRKVDWKVRTAMWLVKMLGGAL
jgi:CDP-diacylglycerol---glycerol-3-phosphate 3-phosphatidyltransferase